MARSNEKPDWFWLRELAGDTAFLRIRWNIIEQQVEDIREKL